MRKIQDDSEQAFAARLRDDSRRRVARGGVPGDGLAGRPQPVPELARAAQARRAPRVLQRGHRPPDRRAELHAGGLVGRHLGDGQLAADVSTSSSRSVGPSAASTSPPSRAPSPPRFTRRRSPWRCSRSTSASRWRRCASRRCSAAAATPSCTRRSSPSMGWRPSRSRHSRERTRRAGPSRACSWIPWPRGWRAGPGATVSTSAAGRGTRRLPCRTSRRPRRSTPCFYLWRRVVPDSGGAGRFRGGNSMELAVIAHGVDTIHHHTRLGRPTTRYRWPAVRRLPERTSIASSLQRETDVLDLLGRAAPCPRRGRRGSATRRSSSPRPSACRRARRHLCAELVRGGRLRRPAGSRSRAGRRRRGRVAVISGDAAERLYGVVLRGAEVDADATAARRDGTYGGPRAAGPGPATVAAPRTATGGRPVDRASSCDSPTARPPLACGSCGAVLSAADGNWKDGARVNELEVPEGNLLCPDPTVWSTTTS